jgi:glutaminyl-peptide cyclotransferase
MGRGLPALLLSAALLAAGCGNGSGDAPPPDRRTAPPVPFTAADATNALSAATELAVKFSPRDAGTEGAAKAAEWIRAQLEKRGVKAEADSFEAESPRGLKPFHNIYAAIPGSGNGWVVFLSHFDTQGGIPGFQGANDGASSTGLLLTLAERLAGTSRGPNVLFGFLDGEEAMIAYGDKDGFQGSKRLADKLRREGRLVKGAILLDMVGDRDLKLTMPRNGTANLRVLGLEAADAVGERAKIGLYDGYIFDDHQAFLDAGFPAVDLIDFDYGSAPGLNDYWHTAKDTPDKLSADSLLSVGRIVLEMLRRLE